MRKPDLCPQVLPETIMEGKRCGVGRSFEDENVVHHCFLWAVHGNQHLCPCGRQWPAA
jgi:hypothetical protein